MTEHKFTDEEIIKALECCSSAECEKCEYVPQGDCYQGSLACNDDLMRSALDLINRQKAEIEMLTAERDEARRDVAIEIENRRGYAERINESIVESKKSVEDLAIKRFAEKANRRLPIVSPSVFDQIVKELTEEQV